MMPPLKRVLVKQLKQAARDAALEAEQMLKPTAIEIVEELQTNKNKAMLALDVLDPNHQLFDLLWKELEPKDLNDDGKVGFWERALSIVAKGITYVLISAASAICTALLMGYLV